MGDSSALDHLPMMATGRGPPLFSWRCSTAYGNQNRLCKWMNGGSCGTTRRRWWHHSSSSKTCFVLFVVFFLRVVVIVHCGGDGDGGRFVSHPPDHRGKAINADTHAHPQATHSVGTQQLPLRPGRKPAVHFWRHFTKLNCIYCFFKRPRPVHQHLTAGQWRVF